MLQAIRKHLNPATAMAFIALVLAMTGGAYAVGSHNTTPRTNAATAATAAVRGSAAKSRYVITSARQISPAVLKSLQGKAGPAGAAGAAGPAGPAGSAGAAGAKGETGAAGAGSQGERGLQGERGSQGERGPQGERGVKGLQGEPWTPNSQLPPGATETGAWSFGPLPTKEGVNVYVVAGSFTIQLAKPLGETQVHYINTEGKEETILGTSPQTVCKGTVEEPSAEPGNLCVYEGEVDNAHIFFVLALGEDLPGASTAGARAWFVTAGTGEASGRGTWALTAE